MIQLIAVSQFVLAEVKTQTLNQTVDAANLVVAIDFNEDQVNDVNFNFLSSNGSISVTGQTNGGFQYKLATEVIAGVNSKPTKVFNNKTFTNLTTWKSTGIFLHNTAISFTGFAGTGNQYIVGRMNTFGDSDYRYFWILINLNSAGTQLSVINSAYETEANVALVTGNEGQTGGVGFKLLSTAKVFAVYPQPANKEIEVVTDLPINNCKIFSINGQLLLSQNMSTTKTIEVADLPKGVYLLQLLNNNDIYHTQKISIDK